MFNSVIWDGSTWWRALTSPFGQIMYWLYEFVGNYGVAIILFTLVTKILLFPLAIKQQKNSLNMVRMRPLQEELMKKYGGNQQRYSEELQKLYQREGYSPFSSCLPMLLQMPLLMLLYTIVRRPLTFMAGMSSSEIWQQVQRLGTAVAGKAGTFTVGSAAEVTADNFNRFELQIMHAMENSPVSTTFLGMDLGVTPTLTSIMVIIPILAGATAFLYSFLSQKANPAQQPAEQGGSMKMMLYLMPLMSLWIAFTVPAGLAIYWITSNILGIGQMYLLNFMYNPKKVEAEVRERMLKEKQRAKEKKSAAARKKAEALAGKKKKKTKPTNVIDVPAESVKEHADKE